nr:hypothetical protein [Tanacetum cinerariifolium]
MVAILEKSEHNVDFHPIVDFVEASPLRIETTEEGTKILATVDDILRIVTESSLRRNLKLQDEEGIGSLPDTDLFENLTLMGYNISPNQTFTFQKDEHASPLRDVSEGEACPTDSGFGADQDRENIAKSSTLPYDLAPRVTSPTADEGSMQLKLDELMGLCTSMQRQHLEMVAKFEAHELEINRLKARVKLLKDREGVVAERSRDNDPIKGRNLDEREVAAERVSNDTEEMAIVLTSMDVATVLASRVAKVPTGSGSIPTGSPSAAEVPTGSDVVPTAESETPKKKKIQEQIYIQMARQLEEEMERDDQRMNEQIARDAEIAKIYAEEELQIMIDGLDISNETLEDFIPMGSKEEAKKLKRKGLSLEQESVKKLKSSKEVPEEVKSPDEVPEEKVKEMMQLVPIEEVYVEPLQVKHPIINWKHLDREDCNQLWALIKESLSNRPPTSDKEMELWLHDTYGVDHVIAKDKEIFMLMEKDYPLRKGLAIRMISYKLQVKNYSKMENDLILKIYKIASSLRQQGD